MCNNWIENITVKAEEKKTWNDEHLSHMKDDRSAKAIVIKKR